MPNTNPQPSHAANYHEYRSSPYTMLRTYLCGHPPEAIKVHTFTDGTVQHILLDALPRLLLGEKYLTFSLQQCKLCAAEHHERRKATHPKQAARGLAVHQGEVMREARKRAGGFLDVLRRFFDQSKGNG